MAVLAVLLKFKSILLLLKGVQLAKLFITMGSMFVMIWFEAVRFGWLFGLGFVVLLLLHELGHAIAIRRAGLRSGYPVFIPFVGAFITLKDQIRSPIVESEIALAGPIAGAASSAACVVIYFLTRGRIWIALAHTGFFLNLFNMTPIAPLDGGRAAKVFSRKAWIVGLGILVALFITTQAPQLLLIGFFALMHAFSGASRQRAQGPGDDHDPELEAVTPAARRNVALNFFGLCAFLALGTYLTSTVLSRP